jgi:hypothetical protein
MSLGHIMGVITGLMISIVMGFATKSGILFVLAVVLVMLVIKARKS